MDFNNAYSQSFKGAAAGLAASSPLHKGREAFLSFSPSVMALLLAACGGGNSVSVSPRPKSVRFEGGVVVGTTGDDPELEGTSFADWIIDHEGINAIHAFEGNDYILARGTIHAGDEHDIVKADGNDDTLNGDEGNDVLVAQSGEVNGGDGHDYIQISYNNNYSFLYPQFDFVRTGSTNESVTVAYSIDKNPLSKKSQGTSQVDGGAGNDVIFVASVPDGSELNVVTGGEGDDLMIVRQDSRLTGGIGDDEFFFFFGNDQKYENNENYVIDADLQVEIADFGNGTDKIVLVVDHNAHPEYDEDYDDLISFFLSGTLIDHDSDGVADDLQVVVTTTDSVSKEAQTKTIIFENLNRQLTAEDFEVMSLVQFNGMVDDIQQSYIDAF